MVEGVMVRREGTDGVERYAGANRLLHFAYDVYLNRTGTSGAKVEVLDSDLIYPLKWSNHDHDEICELDSLQFDATLCKDLVLKNVKVQPYS
ncbi:hypothetical protein HDU97_003218 [Phlyctochytrium planicorne]|nr:hypothetical protein HDU97_003218 [Phlyctochytrium planicorne]